MISVESVVAVLDAAPLQARSGGIWIGQHFYIFGLHFDQYQATRDMVGELISFAADGGWRLHSFATDESIGSTWVARLDYRTQGMDGAVSWDELQREDAAEPLRRKLKELVLKHDPQQTGEDRANLARYARRMA